MTCQTNSAWKRKIAQFGKMDEEKNKKEEEKIGSLYVGNLSPETNEGLLYQTFLKMGPILSVRVCRNKDTLKSLGYGYVNFVRKADAEKAMYTLNFTTLKDRRIRIMWSQRDPSLRKSAVGNVFVKNLGPGIGDYTLFNLFSAYGRVLSCKVATYDNNESKGYGFVQYDNVDSAQVAIDRLNGMLLEGKMITVTNFLPKTARRNSDMKSTNLYIKNLTVDVDDDKLKNLFSAYGDITSAKVMLDEDGNSRCFGFVSYQTPEEASRALEEMNGKCVNGKCLYVAVAEKKVVREQKLKNQLRRLSEDDLENGTEFRKLFIKNIPSHMNELELEQMFEMCGTVTSVKVATDEHGVSRGYGFVSFLEPEAALKALTEKNGILIDGKILYVGRALSKCERELLKSHIEKGFAN